MDWAPFASFTVIFGQKYEWCDSMRASLSGAFSGFTILLKSASATGRNLSVIESGFFPLEEATVPGIAPKDAKIVFFDDIAATIQALLSGQVDAAGFSAFAAKSVADRNPDKKLEAKLVVRTAFYAAAVRPADHDLLRFLNTWVFLRTQDGTLAAIYEKHTGVKLIPLPTF